MSVISSSMPLPLDSLSLSMSLCAESTWTAGALYWWLIAHTATVKVLHFVCSSLVNSYIVRRWSDDYRGVFKGSILCMYLEIDTHLLSQLFLDCTVSFLGFNCTYPTWAARYNTEYIKHSCAEHLKSDMTNIFRWYCHTSVSLLVLSVQVS